MSDLLAAGLVLAILVPVLLGLLVLGATWIGVRWVGSEHREWASSVRLFMGLSDRQLRSILRTARAVEFDPGDAIVTEGTPGRSFFLIRSGTAKVSVGGAELAKVGPGSYFGELALIDEGPRTATVTAETQTKTVEVSSSGFSRALSADPEASRAVYLKLRDWLASTGKPLPDAADGPVDREMLLLLSRRIREAQPVEWAEGKAPSRRWPWSRR
jgi:CRP/FNR family cyclic AMP-dependent transcriptional regulator